MSKRQQTGDAAGGGPSANGASTAEAELLSERGGLGLPVSFPASLSERTPEELVELANKLCIRVGLACPFSGL